MQTRPITFFSDRLRLNGDLYLPDGLRPGERRPAVVSCSGYQGLKGIHPARFARVLVPSGYVCLAFDYRGFGLSDGERGRLVPQEQVEDLRAAVSYLESVPEVDTDRVAVVGWGLGGGVAVAGAADDERLRAVVTVNGIGDGERSTRAMHDERSWARLLLRVAEDRRERAVRGTSELVPPFEIIHLDDVTGRYVDAELYKEPGFGSQVSLESADFLLRFRPERVVHRIAPLPLLLVHGAENRLHRPEESRSMFELAEEPKALDLLEGAGHTEWMFDDHPTFLRLARRVRDFLDTELQDAAPARQSA